MYLLIYYRCSLILDLPGENRLLLLLQCHIDLSMPPNQVDYIVVFFCQWRIVNSTCVMVLSCAYIYFFCGAYVPWSKPGQIVFEFSGRSSIHVHDNLYSPWKKEDPIHHGGITYILNLSMALIFPKTAQNCLEVQFQFFLWKYIYIWLVVCNIFYFSIYWE